jgi:hypothetical protein
MAKTKKALSSWNMFVMSVKKNNPEKSFGDVLKLASKMKKTGSQYANFVASKTSKAAKKVTNTLKLTKTRKGKKGKKGKKGRKSRKN